MPETDQETKPGTEQETKPQPEQTAKPEKGREKPVEQPSKPAAAPSQTQITKEQYDAAVKEMNRLQRAEKEYEQRLAEETASRRRLEQFAQEQLGVAKAATDPEQSAWKDYMEAKVSYDPEAESVALQRYLEARDQKRQNAWFQQVLQAQKIQAELPRAGEALGIQDQNALSQQLTSVHQSLTPYELSMIALHRKGKLVDHLSTEQKSREEAAQRAEALKSLGGGGGGRVVPGSLSAQPEKAQIDWISYRTKSKSVRDKIDEAVQNGQVELVNRPED